MTQFHTDDYIDFLSRVTPDNMEALSKEQAKCKTNAQYLTVRV
jgi:histone deacetylase 1/2